MARRKLPWTIIASAAIAGASFVAVANYVSGVRNLPLENDRGPAQVSDITPPNRQDDPGSQKPIDHGTKHNSERVSAEALNSAVQKAGYDGVRVLGVEVSNGIATIDMNSGFVDTLGSSGEGELLDVLRTSLAKHPSVKSMQIRIDGEIQKTLGHTDLSSPLSVRS